MSELSLQQCIETFEHISDAIVIFDAHGKIVFHNKAYVELSPSLQDCLITPEQCNYPGMGVLQTKKMLKKITLSDGHGFVIKQPRHHETAAEKTLKVLMNALQSSNDIYASAALAIQQCLGWRWVAITRFTDDTSEHLEVLSFLDKEQHLDTFEYAVAGTPCEMVVDTNEFTVFSNLEKAFPDYAALQEMGAKNYAGLVYRNADGKPLGHIMAMHDSDDVNFSIAEDVINIATIALSSQFQLHKTVSQLANAEQRMRKDGLTGIGNRVAFDDAIMRAGQSYHANAHKDWTLAIIDLDNLKPLNDYHGHAAGDNFIKLMATELANLGRQSDTAFRIGGDEFAIIFSHNGNKFIDVIRHRFGQALQRIRSNLRFNVDASIGFATLYEAKGSLEQWSALADQRMYDEKTLHKQTPLSHVQHIVRS